MFPPPPFEFRSFTAKWFYKYIGDFSLSDRYKTKNIQKEIINFFFFDAIQKFFLPYYKINIFRRDVTLVNCLIKKIWHYVFQQLQIKNL